MKLSHGDSVIIIAGKDKGKKGIIMRVLTEANRVIVSDINMVTKHIKKTAQAPGRKVQFEASIHISNVQIVDPKTGKASRIGYKVDAKTGQKVRFSKKSGTALSRMKVDFSKDGDKKTALVDPKTVKKQGFWKKVGFGSNVPEGKAEAGPAPTQSTIQTRSTGRGS